MRGLMARILVIDDDPNILRSVREILEEEGHDVREAVGGEAALELLAGASVDLIVSDLNMPEIDGIELLIRVHDEYPGTRLVAMSGGGRIAKEELLRNASMLGAVVALEKPFTVEQLVDIVNGALKADRTDGIG